MSQTSITHQAGYKNIIICSKEQYGKYKKNISKSRSSSSWIYYDSDTLKTIPQNTDILYTKMIRRKVVITSEGYLFVPTENRIVMPEYNADHRAKWKDVMRDLIMFDADILMEFLYEHREDDDLLYDDRILIKSHYDIECLQNNLERLQIPHEAYKDIKFEIVKKCKEKNLTEIIYNNTWDIVRVYTYTIHDPTIYKECVECYRFKGLPYKKPHVISKFCNIMPYVYKYSEGLFDGYYHTAKELLHRSDFILHISKDSSYYFSEDSCDSSENSSYYSEDSCDSSENSCDEDDY